MAGREASAQWADTPFGSLVTYYSDEHSVEIQSFVHATRSEVVAVIDFDGVDQASVEILTQAVLMGKYLNKPGVKDKGDAVLFVVVNEALRELDKIARICDPD